jgi:hypothetical protein
MRGESREQKIDIITAVNNAVSALAFFNPSTSLAVRARLHQQAPAFFFTFSIPSVVARSMSNSSIVLRNALLLIFCTIRQLNVCRPEPEIKLNGSRPNLLVHDRWVLTGLYRACNVISRTVTCYHVWVSKAFFCVYVNEITESEFIQFALHSRCSKFDP